MPETPQLYLGLEPGSGEGATGFQGALNYIRESASSTYLVGNEFERLMKQYLSVDPLYKERFTDVYLWREWAALRTEYDGVDIGIDLVARESNGEYCAIQCKCFAEDTRVTKPQINSFISASAGELFTKRILVHTGAELGPNVLRTIKPLGSNFQVIGYGHLASRPIDWPDLRQEAPEQLDYRIERFNLREHQQEAFNDVINGFQDSDRGKLIMACGTGKTFTALRIAEEIAGIGGRVLYLVPSIGLFSQAMREWAEQQGVQHRYIGICSDTSAGKKSEDVPIQELEIPVTTDPLKISEALGEIDADAMTVVFCTYHSLPIVEIAQDQGAPAFDLILCDEAYRTTGIDRPDDKTSPFVLVHDRDRIRAKKRLYMTATPRLYAPNVKARVADHHADLFSMDDPATYGPEFHRLTFSKAVDMKVLADYKVVIFTVYEPDSVQALQRAIDKSGKEINITDVTKMVGCWRALQNPEGKSDDDAANQPLTRAIAFNNTIRNSKRLAEHWNGVIESAIEQMPEDTRPANFECETRHVDGQHNAFDRKNQIEWLKGSSRGVCRILSNARCLSEGIDVPALDAVIFMTPRSSYVDIVQAVGRVMRTAEEEGKEYGYIILPVAIPPGTDPADALDNNERFATIWNVLNALRSHDERFNNEINKIDLNNSRTERIIFTPPNGGTTPAGVEIQQWIDYGLAEIPADVLYAKIVERCGDRRYWESWAKDVADIFQRVVVRIENLLNDPDNDFLGEWFDAFHSELQSSINPSVTRDDAIDMMAQHILTRPVFEALFENYDFAAGNPVSIALDRLRADFEEFGLEDETRDLKGFYESVRMRAQGIDNSKGRQRVLLELYEKFFKTATKKDADRLGIVYTPVDVVDFILHSVDQVLQDEFSKSLSNEGVHVLDPFAGAGIFLSRLLQSNLIQEGDLERKYRHELHANEIVLLAYYIATVNIEEAYRGKCDEDADYEPFNGIVLTDTFNLNKKNKEEDSLLYQLGLLPANNARAERQQNLPIQVIIGNPPWVGGQKSSADNNPSVYYPSLTKRIRKTYGANLTAKGEKHLYNTYKMAIRWASDRIKGQGAIGFVTSGSWIDKGIDAGLRACLAKEFSSIYVLNLRGDAYTSGERRRAEGGNVFEEGSRAIVAITILVKNPNAAGDGCRIYYRDIGDNLKSEQKLAFLKEAQSISGFTDWQEVIPDQYHDWIRQRSPEFDQFYALGSENAKKGFPDDTIFSLYSLGRQTTKDLYVYNFSRASCIENARKMTEDYLAAISDLETNPELSVAEALRRHSSNIMWVSNLMKKLGRKHRTEFDEAYIRKIMFRPFIPTYCYTDNTFAISMYQMGRIFPNSSSENRVICVPGIGSEAPFSALITDTMPDRHFNEACQCYPRYSYPKPPSALDTMDKLPGIEREPDRIDNISDIALNAFRKRYRDDTITKDSIFDYVYGILHSLTYREKFANDLAKVLPRLPFAPDFHAFAKAGGKLATLYLGYETCKQYPLDITSTHEEEPEPRHFLIDERGMRFADNEETTLIINDYVKLSGIPAEAHRYIINGKTPLEWFIERYQINRERGVHNDPNSWFVGSRDLVAAIECIVYVSVESNRIIEGLPSQLTDDTQE